MYPASSTLPALLILLKAPRVVGWFYHFGFFGLFLVSTVDSSFVPLPLPGVTDIMLVLFAAGHGNPIFLLIAPGHAGFCAGRLRSRTPWARPAA